MTETGLEDFRREELIKAILHMGHIIRLLDEDTAYQEYWTLDGEYINDTTTLRRAIRE